MSRAGRSWGKITERIGLLLLVAVAALLSWVLVLRAFGWLLGMLEG